MDKHYQMPQHIPVANHGADKHHYFAFVDPSGTVVYPKAFPKGVYGRCEQLASPHNQSAYKDEENRGNKLVYIGPYGALETGGRNATDLLWGAATDLREQLATSGTGVSYNFETGTLTDKFGVKYKNGERVE